MLNLSAFNHNHHASRVKMVAKFIRRGIRVILHLIKPESILPWFGFCGAFAAANADTWATELGILNRRKPKLIQNGMEVEAGTSGAVSLVGTSAAAAGSLLITALSWILTPVKDPCLWLFALTVFIGGVGGSLLDSWLGATVQAIFYCSKCQKETEKHPLHSCGSSTTPLRGLHWFNNDMVNLCCTLGGSIPVVLLTLFIPVF